MPGRLAVVGGGAVAVEMATAWQGLGSSVTLLARRSGLLLRLEPFVGELVGYGLADAGVDVRVGVSVTKLRRADGAGPVTLDLDDGTELEVDEVCSPPAGHPEPVTSAWTPSVSLPATGWRSTTLAK